MITLADIRARLAKDELDTEEQLRAVDCFRIHQLHDELTIDYQPPVSERRTPTDEQVDLVYETFSTLVREHFEMQIAQSTRPKLRHTKYQCDRLNEARREHSSEALGEYCEIRRSVEAYTRQQVAMMAVGCNRPNFDPWSETDHERITEFAEWLEPLLPAFRHKSTEEILAVYFGIDLREAEAERQQMLDELQATPDQRVTSPLFIGIPLYGSDQQLFVHRRSTLGRLAEKKQLYGDLIEVNEFTEAVHNRDFINSDGDGAQYNANGKWLANTGDLGPQWEAHPDAAFVLWSNK